MSDNAKVSLKLNLTEFELPPTRDALVIARNAPMGTEAATRMLDAACPDEFVVLRVEDEQIESILVRQSLLRSVPADQLVPTILAHARGLIRHHPLLRVRIEVAFDTEKVFDAWKRE